MKIATLSVDTNTYDIFLKDGNYVSVNCLNNEENNITKATIAHFYVGNAWDEDSIIDTIEEENGEYIATKFIPIYDFIDISLYGYGKTQSEAKDDLTDRYKDFILYDENINFNIERNRQNHMKKVHRFAIIPVDRQKSIFDKNYYENMELIFFKDSLSETRQLLIDSGIPDDGRADDGITGYVENNKIVFTRNGFIKDEYSKYIEAIKEYLDKIKKHYNLKKPELYFRARDYMDIFYKNGFLDESIVDSDFDYYYPIWEY